VSGVSAVSHAVEAVVKLGGGLLAFPDCFDAALDAITAAAQTVRLLVVPGGGPFADAVREVDRRWRLPDAAAHWMAVLAMDQHAHLVVARLSDGVLAEDARGISEALEARRLPVLAPSRWLRAADPLPHSWDVTSDTIAAWITGQVGAARLVLVKPPGASGPDLTDVYFTRALPANVTWVVVAGDRSHDLAAALDCRPRI